MSNDLELLWFCQLAADGEFLGAGPMRRPTLPYLASLVETAAEMGFKSLLTATNYHAENEAWTASGNVRRENLQYVIRISPTWQVRQFLLFRDMDEPDLWLGTDGRGNWGEMNGAHRRELDGCIDMCLSCTPFTSTIPIRRLSLPVGTTAEIVVATIDVETLDVQPDPQRYTRLDSHRWRFEQLDTERSIEFDVDEFGLVIDYPPSFRRADYN